MPSKPISIVARPDGKFTLKVGATILTMEPKELESLLDCVVETFEKYGVASKIILGANSQPGDVPDDQRE